MVLRNRKVLVLLLLAVAVPATAQTFGFSIGSSEPAACLSIGDATYRIAPDGARPDYTVRIDAAAPSPAVRIQIAETADEADFVFVDDGEATVGCPRGAACIRNVRIDPAAAKPDLIMGFATSTMPADYRVFVRSRRLSPEAAGALYAAALIPRRTLAGKTASMR